MRYKGVLGVTNVKTWEIMQGYVGWGWLENWERLLDREVVDVGFVNLCRWREMKFTSPSD